MTDDDRDLALLRLQQDLRRAQEDRSKYTVVWTADLRTLLQLLPADLETLSRDEGP